MCVAQGFYRTVPSLKECLLIGPYQGRHGCLSIPYCKGVCGAAARSLKTQVTQAKLSWKAALHQLVLLFGLLRLCALPVNCEEGQHCHALQHLGSSRLPC
jgi:hypothetical protein